MTNSNTKLQFITETVSNTDQDLNGRCLHNGFRMNNNSLQENEDFLSQYKETPLDQRSVIYIVEERENLNKIKLDDILEYHVGEFGPYQKLIYVLACIPAICAAYFTLMPVFLLGVPNHRCKVPGLTNDTYTIQSHYHESLVNESVPWNSEDNAYMQCSIYEGNNKSSTTECQEWVYDESNYHTAVSDYNLVCSREMYVQHFKTITFLGALVGGFINGILSDRFGRKKTFLLCLASYFVETVVFLLSPNFMVLLGIRFLLGASGIGVFMIAFVFVMEFVGPHYRMFAGIFIEIFWCVGEFILVGCAYLIKDWKHLVIGLSAPCILLISYIWILPESPRWLIMKGRIKEAEVVLKRVAKSNNTKLPDGLLRKIERNSTANDESGHFWKLCKSKVVLIRTIIIIFNRFALQMCYYGINLNPEFLRGNMFVTFTLMSGAEMAAIIVVLLFISRFGRKPLYCSSMMLSAAAFICSAVPLYIGSDSDKIWIRVLAMVAKFGVSGAFSVMYVYGCELFPTSIRNSALGLSFVIELLGGALSQYIVGLGKAIGGLSEQGFPVLVFGTVSCVAAMLSLFLPETRNRKLPETVEDAENFGRFEVE